MATNEAHLLFYQPTVEAFDGPEVHVFTKLSVEEIENLLDDLKQAEADLQQAGNLRAGRLAQPRVFPRAFRAFNSGDRNKVRYRAWRQLKQENYQRTVPCCLPLPKEVNPETWHGEYDEVGLKATVTIPSREPEVQWHARYEYMAGWRSLGRLGYQQLQHHREQLRIYQASGPEQEQLVRKASESVRDLIQRDAELLAESYVPTSRLLDLEHVPDEWSKQLPDQETLLQRGLAHEDPEVRRELMRSLGSDTPESENGPSDENSVK